MRNSAFLLVLLGLINFSCKESNPGLQSPALLASGIPETKPEDRLLSDEFKSYWYAGVAELTSYELKQARYGNLNEGHAVLVFVTEPFNPKKQVKADRPSDQNTSVLKFNATKKFLTGLYPYSIMTSTFLPVREKGHALKVTNSVQEWCGHVYSQLNNRDRYEITAHSYFESEGDRELELDKTLLEDELWALIRLAPEELPVGEFEILPSFEYLRLKHKLIQSHTAILEKQVGEEYTIYSIAYPELDRTVKITFSTDFPYTIEEWEESAPAGFMSDGALLTTTAKRIERIQAPYWRLHDPKDEQLRSQIGL